MTSIDRVTSSQCDRAPHLPAPVSPATDLRAAAGRDLLIGLERSRIDLDFLEQLLSDHLLGGAADQIAARALASARVRLDRMVEQIVDSIAVEASEPAGASVRRRRDVDGVA